MAQLVARYLGVVEAARSSRVTQTKKLQILVHFALGFGAFSLLLVPFCTKEGATQNFRVLTSTNLLRIPLRIASTHLIRQHVLQGSI